MDKLEAPGHEQGWDAVELGFGMIVQRDRLGGWLHEFGVAASAMVSLGGTYL